MNVTATVAEYQAKMFKALELVAEMRKAQRSYWTLLAGNAPADKAFVESKRLEKGSGPDD